MCIVPADVSAAQRAQWLAELSEALDEALDLLGGLDFALDRRIDGRDLYLKIEAARIETRSLRLSRSVNPALEKSSERIELGLWLRDDSAA